MTVPSQEKTEEEETDRPRRPPRSDAPAASDAAAAEDPLDRYGIPLGLFLFALLVYYVVNHGRPATLDYFVPLADAFIHGQLGLDATYSYLGEAVLGPNGLYNVVYPPAPAVLLIPYVLVLGAGVEQVGVSILLGALNVALMSLILKEMGFARFMRVVLSLAFGFGTIVWFSAQAGTAWHLAHVVSIFFILLTILACQRNARTWVIGALFAGAVLSRLPLIAAEPFLLAYFAYRTQHEDEGDRTPFGAPSERDMIGWRWLNKDTYLRLVAPAAAGLSIPLALYVAYNWLRYGSILETGTAMIAGLPDSEIYRNGLFSVLAIPGNLAAMFLAVPTVVASFPFFQPPLLGSLSVILTTPLLLWAVRARSRDWFTIGCWVTLLLLLIPTLLREDPGGVQFGFRYAQDFYPFAFLLAARGLHGRIGPVAWVAIAIGFVVNIWGMGAAYFDWWA